MVRLTLVITAVLAFAGCQKENSAFCKDPMNAGKEGCSDDGPPCSTSTDCKDTNFPACDTAKAGGTCVQCTAADHKACGSQTPRCESNMCVACIDDNDCGAMGVCLLNGGCADQNQIIHVAATGGSSADTCGSAATACTLIKAVTLVTSARNIIKLDNPTTYATDDLRLNNNINVTLDARGATITRSTMGPVVNVDSNASVTIIGGTIRGDSGKNGEGVKCGDATLTLHDVSIEGNDLAGIDLNKCISVIGKTTISNNSKKPGQHVAALNAQMGTLTVSQSTITNNIGGGISIGNGDFTIIGNMVSKNGEERQGGSNPGSPFGGITIVASGTGNRFEFNTIVQNKAQQDIVPGVQCTNAGFHLVNNIIWDNMSASGTPPTEVPQTGGNCVSFYSDIKNGPDTNNNLHVDPMFETDFRLKSTSPLLGKADPGADLSGIASKDINGDARVKRSGMGADIGADQYKP